MTSASIPCFLGVVVAIDDSLCLSGSGTFSPRSHVARLVCVMKERHLCCADISMRDIMMISPKAALGKARLILRASFANPTDSTVTLP